MLPDDVDDELGRDETRHDEDPLAGRGGRGEGEDVRPRYIADVDLRRLVRGELTRWCGRGGGRSRHND